MVLLAVGVDEALRVDPDPVLLVDPHQHRRHPDLGHGVPGLHLPAGHAARWGDVPALYGNRGTARYVGLQTMDGIVSTTNCLVDDLDVDADGNFEVILSGRRARGQLAAAWQGDHPTLVVRHFFYDWDTEKPSSLQIERIGERGRTEGPLGRSRRRGIAPDVRAGGVRPRQPEVLSRLQRGAARSTGSCPRSTARRSAPPRRTGPVIGRFELEQDEALILEVEPPKGVYWSYSLGNQWWETIHYGRHQSSLNAHQANVDSDGDPPCRHQLARPRRCELA